jgi:hypothetical protein
MSIMRLPTDVRGYYWDRSVQDLFPAVAGVISKS